MPGVPSPPDVRLYPNGENVFFVLIQKISFSCQLSSEQNSNIFFSKFSFPYFLIALFKNFPLP